MKDEFNSHEGEKRDRLSVWVFFVTPPRMLAERGTLEPRFSALSDLLPALAGEYSAGLLTLASRLVAYIVLNKINLLCRPLRGSGSLTQRTSREDSGTRAARRLTWNVGIELHRNKKSFDWRLFFPSHPPLKSLHLR